MAITRVGITGPVTANNANLTVTEPTGTAQGDLLLVWIAHRSTIGYQAPTGWTKLLDASSGNTTTTASTSTSSGELFYIVRGASAPTLVFTKETGTGSVAIARCIAYRGVLNRYPIRGSNITTLGSAGTTLSTTVAKGGRQGDRALVLTALPNQGTSSAENYSGALTEFADSAFATTPFVSSAVADGSLSADVADATAATATASTSGRGTIACVLLAVDNPKIDTFSDTFDDGLLTGWTVQSSASAGSAVTEQNGRVEFSFPSSNSGYLRLTRTLSQTLIYDSAAYARVLPLPPSPSGVDHCEMQVRLGSVDGAYGAKLTLGYGGYLYQKIINGVVTDVWASWDNAQTYSESNFAWVRLRETAGTMYVDRAPLSASNPPASGDWVNFASFPFSDIAAGDWSSTVVIFDVGSWDVSVIEQIAWIDGFNTSATTTSAVTGTLSSTLAGVTMSTSGGPQYSGALAATLGTVLPAVTGSETFSGTLSSTLAGVTMNTTSGSENSGSLNATLDTVLAAITGGETFAGSMTGVLSATTMSASGGLQNSGSLAATLSTVVPAITGGETFSGALSGTLAGAAMSMTGTQKMTGTLGATLSGVTPVIGGGITYAGTLSATLADSIASFIGAMTESVSGTMSATLGSVSMSMYGDTAVPGALVGADTVDWGRRGRR